MMIALSLILAIFPILGIAFILTYGNITTVDGLFTTLILLTLTGILFLNVALDVRKRMHPKKQETEKTA